MVIRLKVVNILALTSSILIIIWYYYHINIVTSTTSADTIKLKERYRNNTNSIYKSKYSNNSNSNNYSGNEEIIKKNINSHQKKHNSNIKKKQIIRTTSDNTNTYEKKYVTDEHLQKCQKVDVKKVKRKRVIVNTLATTAATTITTTNTTTTLYNAQRVNVSWKEFTSYPMNHITSPKVNITPLNIALDPLICPIDVVNRLKVSQLAIDDYKWCKWALDKDGGNVMIGISWGNLNASDKDRFDYFNCNAVNNDKNPSCDDLWGDEAIFNWKKVVDDGIKCNKNKKSKVDCYLNDNDDAYCTIENAQINFSKWRGCKRERFTDSKMFDNSFLSSDCNDNANEPTMPFSYLYQPFISSDQCDYVHNGTVLMYSHDHISNLGHTLNDIMNVWIMLWLENIARISKDINFLNIDSFNLGNNHYDNTNVFFTTYEMNFNDVIKGMDFHKHTLCIQKLLIQPSPPKYFVWDGWNKDSSCSFVGPSSLFQRWNMHVRNSYGFLKDHSLLYTNNVFKILLIVREEADNLWGFNRSSRKYLNPDDIIISIKKTVKVLQKDHPEHVFKFDTAVLSDYDFTDQLKIIGDTSIMIGMHGAGMASSMHMSLGNKYCCGVIEFYPSGEFTPIRGHGNMARRMGIKYERIDISVHDSKNVGAIVPVKELDITLKNMINVILQKPTCVLPQVVNDPYLESNR